MILTYYIKLIEFKNIKIKPTITPVYKMKTRKEIINLYLKELSLFSLLVRKNLISVYKNQINKIIGKTKIKNVTTATNI